MINMENEDKWLNAMRRQLEDYEVTPSDDLWQQLERELKAPSVHRARIVPLWIKSVAAAAVVCIAGGSWFFFSHYLDKSADKTVGQRTASFRKADMLAKQENHPLNKQVETSNSSVRTNAPTLIHEKITNPASEKNAAVQSDVDEDSIVLSATPQNVMAMSAASTEVTTSEVPTTLPEHTEEENGNTAAKEKPQNWYDNLPESDRMEIASNTAVATSADKKHWVVSLTAMNGLPSIGGNMGRGEAMASAMSDASANLHPFGSASVGDYVMMNQPILSSKQPAVRSLTSAKHKIPVSYGASVRYNVTPEWGVETGLSYTILSSSFTNERLDKRISYDQNLHYLEIPVRVNYLFVNQRWFSVYAAGGGAVAKCVYAKMEGSDMQNHTLGEKPWQFSLTGAVGAQLNIVDHVGVYLEPGVGYYFKDNSSLRTVYKDHPWVFKLNFGLRLSY